MMLFLLGFLSGGIFIVLILRWAADGTSEMMYARYRLKIKLITLSSDEIERRFQEPDTFTTEVSINWEEYFAEAERYARELGFKSFAKVPMEHDEFEDHMIRFAFEK